MSGKNPPTIIDGVKINSFFQAYVSTVVRHNMPLFQMQIVVRTTTVLSECQYKATN